MKRLCNLLVVSLIVLVIVFLSFASYHSTDSTEVGVRTVKWLGTRGVEARCTNRALPTFPPRLQ